MKQTVRFSLDGLGMSHDAMVEMVARMNAGGDATWVLIQSGGWQMRNPAPLSTYSSMRNPLL